MELVKLRNLQNTLSLEQTNANKASRAEIQEQLRPLDESLADSLPSHIDEETHRAIVTELKSMIDVERYN